MLARGTIVALLQPNQGPVTRTAPTHTQGEPMTQILLAAFHRYSEAEQVKTELLSRGIASDAIQISASMNPETVDSSRIEVIGEAPDEDASVADKLGSFFSKVFGDSSGKHAGRYPEAARRGSTLLTVTLEDESEVDAVEQLMERHGAIDIDERSARWGSDEATPVTASTATLTTGYPDATSITEDERVVDGSSMSERGAAEGSFPGREENDRAGRRDNTAGRVRIIPR
jgi:hypothetical protein